ncbi:MAG: HAD family hydrolase [Candidatus Nanohaloarchaea archaeon]|nr:HAD family hydrolase [Candidatus Nanohaloarchaea archaeon]
MVRAVIFDADHTIYVPRTEQAYREKFKYLSQRLGVSQDRLRSIWEEQVDEALNADDPEKRKREVVLEKTLMETELPADQRGELAEEAVERFWSHVVDDIEYDEETEAMMDRLRQQGLDMVAVASDEFREPLERKLNHMLGDWERYFDMLVTPESAGSMKPSKDFYRSILAEEDLEAEEVVVVGDSWERDLQPAADMGLVTVLLSDEADGDPDFVIDKLAKLEQIIEKL